MKLVFLGTRGNIEASTRRHRRHSAAMVSYYGRRVMVDCGEDWHRMLDELDFEAFPVLHSTRAPAVGCWISAGAVTIFYVPDVAWIIDREEALPGCKLYIGDGATIRRSMVRKPHETIIGHVPIRTQLTWCKKEGVPRAVFTHCGSGIVEGDERVLGAEIRDMAAERGLWAEIAHDDMELVLR